MEFFISGFVKHELVSSEHESNIRNFGKHSGRCLCDIPYWHFFQPNMINQHKGRGRWDGQKEVLKDRFSLTTVLLPFLLGSKKQHRRKSSISDVS